MTLTRTYAITLTRTYAMTLTRFFIMTLLLMVPNQAFAGSDCLPGFRAAFEKVSESKHKLEEMIESQLHKKGRAQSVEVEKILDNKIAQWKKSGSESEASWLKFVEEWEHEVTPRTGRGTYPRVEELLALWSAKSPTFHSGLKEFLTDHGAVRFKVLAHFMEEIPGQVGKKVTYGRRFWELWRTRIRLPMRETWTPDDFSLFMVETSNAMFRAMNPQPGFARAWLASFKQVRLDPETWKVWKPFAETFLKDYRERHAAFLKGVTLETYGKPRPEVLRDFYRFGMWDAVYRRIAATKVGLKPEVIEALTKDNPLYDKLPRAVKNTMIFSKYPELYQELRYTAEVEQLAFEVMWFMRPVVSGLTLYSVNMLNNELQKMQAEKGAQDEPPLPKSYKPTKADEDAVKSFEIAIEQETIEKRALERELSEKGSALSEGEIALRNNQIDRLNRNIKRNQEALIYLQRKMTEVHS